MSLVLRDLEDLLFLDKPLAKSSGSSVASKKKALPEPSDPYNRQKYYRYAADKDKAFKELYAFCFALAKPPYVQLIFLTSPPY